MFSFRHTWMYLGIFFLLAVLPSCKGPTPKKIVQKETILSPICTKKITTFSAPTKTKVPVKKKSPLYWNWEQIDETAVDFPDNFLWGVATSAHQIESNCTNSDWAQWEKTGNVNQLCGHASSFQEHFDSDLERMKSLGINAIRMSVEWSKIEPQAGECNQQELQRYAHMCKKLRDAGIAPCVTLHHFTNPAWFLDMGGFEKEENISYFVRFAKKVYEQLHPYVTTWFTFTSPTSYAGRAYYKKIAPPGIHDAQLMQEVIKNILEAHVQVYQTFKTLPNGSSSRIGFQHNTLLLEAGHFWDRIGIHMARALLDENVYGFFRTGTFKVSVPTKAHLTHINMLAPKSLDFICLSFYSHAQMNNFDVRKYPEGIGTQNSLYSIYPEGLYRAIEDISTNLAQPLGIPIYVTENGIATDNESHRDLFFRRYLYALSQAIQEGYNVAGYFAWTFMDCYEWGTYGKKYGIYAVDHATGKRSEQPRTGAQYLIDVIHHFGSKKKES